MSDNARKAALNAISERMFKLFGQRLRNNVSKEIGALYEAYKELGGSDSMIDNIYAVACCPMLTGEEREEHGAILRGTK